MGIIVVPITAGVGCATGILVNICSSYLKKKEQNYKLKYTIIQRTLDNFRQLFNTSLKDNHIDEKEYHRFVNMYENYRTASRAASQSQNNNITKKRDTPNTFLKRLFIQFYHQFYHKKVKLNEKYNAIKLIHL